MVRISEHVADLEAKNAHLEQKLDDLTDKLAHVTAVKVELERRLSDGNSKSHEVRSLKEYAEGLEQRLRASGEEIKRLKTAINLFRTHVELLRRTLGADGAVPEAE